MRKTTKGQDSQIKPLFTLLSKLNVGLCVDDNGHSGHKFAWLDPESFSIKTNRLPSIVGHASKNELKDFSGRALDRYMIGTQSFTCNKDILHPVDVDNERYQTAPENVALTAHGLSINKQDTKPIVLATTLPFSRFYVHGKKNDALIEGVTTAYQNEIKKMVGATDAEFTTITIHSHHIYPEGFIGYYDWAIDDNGNIRTEVTGTSGPVLVVDIGGGTSDVVTILGGSTGLSADFGRSDSIPFGVIRLFVAIRDLLIKKVREVAPALRFGESGAIEQRILEVLLKNGSVTLNGIPQAIDLHTEIEKLKEDFIDDLTNSIYSIVKDITRYQQILFMGGGAVIFADYLKEKLPSSYILDEFANARGALKVLAFKVIPAMEAQLNASQKS